MKKVIYFVVFGMILALTSVVFAGEYNVPLWQKDGTTDTFIAIQSTSIVTTVVTVTFKNVQGNTLYEVTRTIGGGRAWFVDTKDIDIQGAGVVNIFINDSMEHRAPMAIAAMIYGGVNIPVQVWRF